MQLRFKDLDDWQREFIETEGDRVLCIGRQSGKSVTCSIDAGMKAIKSVNKNFLMIAPTERQAYALFEKTLAYIQHKKPALIKKGKDRPTKTRIKLNNGSIIYCLPTGLSGTGIRFLTVDELYVDEASRVPEDVWTAITPMLLTTGGKITLLSTPAGSEGYFAGVVTNREGAFNNFTRFNYSSKWVIENRKISPTWTTRQREQALEYLERERKVMTKLQYAQEYEGVITEDLRRFFSDELIKQSMINKVEINKNSRNYLGVDIARMGGDETVLFTLALDEDIFKQRDLTITSKTHLTDTYREIITKDRTYKYAKIYLDDGGLGVGVLDLLLEDSRTRRKVEAINNSMRSIDYEERKKRIIKEDLYNNLKRLMEQGKVKLLKDERTFLSLSSIQFEYTDNKNLRIFGKKGKNGDHITEALVRAVWSYKEKRKKLFFFTSG